MHIICERRAIEIIGSALHIKCTFSGYKRNLFIQSMRFRFCMEMGNGRKMGERKSARKRKQHTHNATVEGKLKKKRNTKRNFYRECEFMKTKHISLIITRFTIGFSLHISTRWKNLFVFCFCYSTFFAAFLAHTLTM